MSTRSLTVTRANGATVNEMVVCAVDIGRANPAYWVGALIPPPNQPQSQQGWRLAVGAWDRTPLPEGTATQQQASLVRRLCSLEHYNQVTDWSIEQQLPHNRITGRSENVAAYGLQAALFGGLVARPGARTRRVFVRSPQHKFHVLGVDRRLISKKATRKRLTTQLANYYVRKYTATGSTARRVWDEARPKQDDMADVLISGAIELLELDARAKQPRAAALLNDLSTQAQQLVAAMNTPLPAMNTTLPSPPTRRRAPRFLRKKK